MSSASNWSSTFWLPANISPSTGDQDQLFYFIYYLSVFFFILVIGFMVYFMVKYRKKRDGEHTTYVPGNTKLEILWSAIPALLFVIIFAWGFVDWIKLNVPPQGAMEVHVTARKWDWLFTNTKSGSETVDLIVPVNTNIKLVMSSADVIHGFYVPDFRINRDVLPNQYTVTWFKAEKIGSYPILCTQYCGTKHSQMVRYVRVESQQDYEKAMIAAQGAGLTPVQLGKKLFEGKGACASCHDVSTDRKRLVGPPLFAAFGEEQDVIRDGKQEKVKFDENYTRESILNPNFRIVVGYLPQMPPYQGQLSDKEINALIAYIQSLKK